VKNFNKKYNKLMEDMGAGMTDTSVGMANPNPTGNIGQSGPSVYGEPNDARNLFGTKVEKSKKKNKFKAPKKLPGFKTPFKVIRRTPPSL
jgi:hypothetical protein